MNLSDHAKSSVQEDLVALYLRLNRFFVTRFIVHSPVYDENRTEIDGLALRLPFNSEPERERLVPTSSSRPRWYTRLDQYRYVGQISPNKNSR